MQDRETGAVALRTPDNVAIMPMADLHEARVLLDQAGEEVDFVAQPVSRVEAAERALAVRFPPTYRRFVSEFGAGAVGSEEIYGVFNDDFDDHRPPQAVGLTRRFRREGQVAPGLVVIYNVGQGSYYAIDTRQVDERGESPVVSFTPGLNDPSDELEVVAPDFGRFFLDTVRAATGSTTDR